MGKEIMNNKNGFENVATLAEEFATLIENNIDPKKYFKKKKYPDYFEEYCSQKKYIFENITKEMEKVEEDNRQEFLEDIAAGLAKKAGDEIKSMRGMKKRNRQSELNLFLVTSVFPCILKYGEEYADELCKLLIEEWKKTFPGNELGYTD